MKEKLALLAAAVFLSSGAVHAQSTDAVVSGNVLDPSGANVPAATISALNVNTGVRTAVVSNASGVYQFAALPPGNYRFSAEKEGFKPLDLNETTLRVGDHLQQNLTLQLGAATERVQVTADSDS